MKFASGTSAASSQTSPMRTPTAADSQTQVQIRVFQGEREIAEENELLGEFHLSGIPPAPAGTPQIEVTFNIDENGIVNVEAEDKGSGNAESITIEGGAGLSDEQIEQMQEEAEQHAEEDEERRRRIEARNEAESAVQRANKLLDENEENVDDDLREEIEDRIEDVREVLEDERIDPDRLELEIALVADKLDIGVSTIYRMLKEMREEG